MIQEKEATHSENNLIRLGSLGLLIWCLSQALKHLLIPLKSESRENNKNDRKKNSFKCCQLEGICNVKIMVCFDF